MFVLNLILDAALIFFMSSIMWWILQSEELGFLTENVTRLIDSLNSSGSSDFDKFPVIAIPKGLPQNLPVPVLLIIGGLICVVFRLLLAVFSKNRTSEISNKPTALSIGQNNISDAEESADDNSTLKKIVKGNKGKIYQRIQSTEQSIQQLTQRVTQAEMLNLKLEKEFMELQAIVREMEAKRLQERVETEQLNDSRSSFKNKQSTILNELHHLGQLIKELRANAKPADTSQEDVPNSDLSAETELKFVSARDISQSNEFSGLVQDVSRPDEFSGSGEEMYSSPVAPFYLSSPRLRNPAISASKSRPSSSSKSQMNSL